MFYIVFPARLDFDYIVLPIVNWCLVGAAAVLFLSGLFLPSVGREAASFSLKGGNPLPVMLAIFVNTKPVGLMVGLLLLWIFGGAVNSTVGNAWYAALLLLFGSLGSLLHLLGGHYTSPGLDPVVASVMGMALVAFPLSEVQCYYAGFGFFGIPRFGSWQFRTYWFVAGWIGLTGIMAAAGFGAATLGSQLISFVTSAAAALILVYAGRIRSFTPTIVDVAKGHGDDDEFKRDNRLRDQLEMIMDPEAPSQDEVMEIGRRLKREGKETHATWVGGGGVPSGTIESPSVDEGGPNPRIRVVRTERKEGVLTCYFVNDGDEVRNIEILPASGQTARFHPRSKLGKRESGWFSTNRIPAGPVEGMEFVITFDGAAGLRAEKKFKIRADL